MACLTVMDGPLKGQRKSLDQTITRIGRREGNDWVLQDASISGTHCEIEKVADGILIRDLGSTNGTKVNMDLVKERPLFRNDIVQVGEVSVMIEGEDVRETTRIDTSAIPRTTIVIPQKRVSPPPKVFVKKSSANRIWVTVIALLLALIFGLGYLFFKG